MYLSDGSCTLRLSTARDFHTASGSRHWRIRNAQDLLSKKDLSETPSLWILFSAR